MPQNEAEWRILLDKLGSAADDRTAVILGGTLIEELLESLVRSWLLPDATLGCLSSFGAKKELAHALGMIDDEQAEQLQAIASIRNVFAHNLLDATFEHPEVQANLDKLRKVKGASPDEGAPRTRFRNAVVQFAVLLNFKKRDPVTAEMFRREAAERDAADWKAARERRRGRRREKGGD